MWPSPITGKTFEAAPEILVPPSHIDPAGPWDRKVTPHMGGGVQAEVRCRGFQAVHLGHVGTGDWGVQVSFT